MDAELDGHIPRGDKAAREVLRWAHTLTHHAADFGWSEAMALNDALAELGVQPKPPVISYNEMTPQGRKVMIEAERELDRLAARYFVDGSRLWWLLAPARLVWRSLRHRVADQHTPIRVSPEDAATKMRKASASSSESVKSSVKALLGPDESRHAIA